jgi:hypothetical protein
MIFTKERQLEISERLGFLLTLLEFNTIETMSWKPPVEILETLPHLTEDDITVVIAFIVENMGDMNE